MTEYVVLIELPSGQRRTHRQNAETLVQAINDALYEGHHRLNDPVNTRAISAEEL
jgi:hypothetical protein